MKATQTNWEDVVIRVQAQLGTVSFSMRGDGKWQCFINGLHIVNEGMIESVGGEGKSPEYAFYNFIRQIGTKVISVSSRGRFVWAGTENYFCFSPVIGGS